MSLCRSGSCTPRRAESTTSLVTLTVRLLSRGKRQDATALSTTSCSTRTWWRAAEHLGADAAGAVDHERRRVALRHAERVTGLLVAQQLAVRDLVRAHELVDLLREPESITTRSPRSARAVLPVELGVVGISLMQGPHHVAQKSTTTTLPLSESRLTRRRSGRQVEVWRGLGFLGLGRRAARRSRESHGHKDTTNATTHLTSISTPATQGAWGRSPSRSSPGRETSS